MKVILFFGHHKVGSTALQTFFARNHLKLLQQGILYPSVEVEGLVQALAGALAPKHPPSLEQMNVREPHNALAFRMLAQANGGKTPPWHGQLPGLNQMIRAIRLQVQVLKPHTVILCSEVMSNFGDRHPDLISRLRGIFPEAEHELYCALRRPDEYLMSWHAQRLRFGEKLHALSGTATANYMRGIHFDYQRMLTPWVKRFPGARLHLRNYADIMAAGGSVADFTAQVGCDFPARLSSEGPANHGLPRAAMEIVRRGNHDLPAPQAQALCRYLLDQGAALTPVANADVEMFGAQQRALLAERFAPIHAYLSDLAGQPFFPDIERMTNPRPVPEAEANARLLERIDPAALPDPALRDYVGGLRAALTPLTQPGPRRPAP